VVCIADEVFTGFGRTGKLFASDYLRNSPDIIALSKGLTGGTLPLGVTSCNQKIVDAFTSQDFSKTFFHGHSYTGNPLSCTAANASFKLLTRSECKENIDRIGNQHKTFSTRLANNPKVKDARTLGTILAIELAAGKTAYDNVIRKTIYSFFLDRDILLRPLGNVIYILPPYIITDAELKTIYDAIEDFLKQV
jgi:adenosylmethionine-8-amino-7-oxononanoate aminotransferase